MKESVGMKVIQALAVNPERNIWVVRRALFGGSVLIFPIPVTLPGPRSASRI